MMFLLHSSSSAILKFSALALLFYGGCKVTVAKNATFPALIVFGDSIADSGNNNYLSTIVKCDFPPYGRDFQKGKPTGRFCNGKIPSDVSAEFYGIKELLPPYLDPNLQLQDLLTGVSFASGGAGYDPLTAKIVLLGSSRTKLLGLSRTQLLGSATNPAPGFVSEPRGRVCDELAPGFISEPRGGVCDEPAPGSRQTKLLGSSQSPGAGFVANPGTGFVSEPKREVRREPSSWVRLRTEAEGVFDLGGKKIRKNTYVLSLSDQLELFKKYKEKITSALGGEQTVTFLSKALFFVCCGSDDIANTYFSTPLRSAHYDIDSYTDLAVNYASQFFQELYGLGARRVLAAGLPPIGCVPSQRTLGGGLTRGCANKSNHAALLYNSKLSAQMDSLKNSLPGFKIVYADVYNPLLSIIQNPKQYGFEEVSRGCCGTGNIEVSILCNHPSDEQTCTDVSKFVFWDSYHPSEKAYKILTTMILNQHTKELL
ncbi:hypothetical protein SLEP1_g52208 [Rubroshorea leprosula]|uniref:GDSL esterase/lipase EXL3 n=1 Tax=Rubroshorea leprosula TaxID=152421 RepID=A0AAV5M7V3_9ROSI|nr:hypothetical protein SLEP1_g52208 [Rubroshorea leprosula]